MIRSRAMSVRLVSISIFTVAAVPMSVTRRSYYVFAVTTVTISGAVKVIGVDYSIFDHIMASPPLIPLPIVVFDFPDFPRFCLSPLRPLLFGFPHASSPVPHDG